MRVLFYLCCFFLQLDAYAGIEPERVLSVTKRNAAPKIDGLLNEDIWKDLPAADNFIINSPNFGVPSSFKTKVYVVYDDQAIYIGAYLYDDPAKVRKQLTARDGESRQDVDYFSVFLDTYNDDQNGFQFLVTSQNVQSDGRLIPNRGSGSSGDYSWDAVWESKVSFQSDGWIVEMKIPFFSIRFAQKDYQDWGVNFQRYVRRENENAYWNPVNPNENGFVNQFGLLKGFEKLTPPLRLSVLPYVTTGYRNIPTSSGNQQSWLRNGGLDLKYGVNESFTLDMTLVPDFGQVISDNVINNLSPFEVQFQENRPFFTEGTEIFNKSGLFYSRRVGATPSGYFSINNLASSDSIRLVSNPGVVQLLNATKFSGRNQNKTAIGIFNAVGAAMFAEIENTNTKTVQRIQTEPLTNYNMIVVDQALKGRSSFTFTNANVWREGGRRNSNVAGGDLVLFDKKNRYSMQAQFNYSRITGTNNYDGYKNLIRFAKVSGKWQFSLLNNIESDRYDPNDLGILMAPNEFTTVARISYNQFTPIKKFNAYSYGGGVRIERLYKPFVFTNIKYDLFGFWFFKNFWDLTVSVETQPLWQKDYFELRTPGRFMRRVPWAFAFLNGSTDSRKKLFARIRWGFGETVDVKKDAYWLIQPGVRYRFNDHLSLDADLRQNFDNGQFGYAFIRETNGDPIMGRRKNKDVTLLLTGIYNFTPRMNITLRARHYWNRVTYQEFYNIDQGGWWIKRAFIPGQDQNVNLWNMDVFFTWDFNYGSRFIVGWKNWLANEEPIDGNRYRNYTANAYRMLLSPHGNELTTRLIFFIDYNSIRKKKKQS